MWTYFTYTNITYNLRKRPILYLSSTYSTYYGIFRSFPETSDFK